MRVLGWGVRRHVNKKWSSRVVLKNSEKSTALIFLEDDAGLSVNNFCWWKWASDTEVAGSDVESPLGINNAACAFQHRQNKIYFATAHFHAPALNMQSHKRVRARAHDFPPLCVFLVELAKIFSWALVPEAQALSLRMQPQRTSHIMMEGLEIAESLRQKKAFKPTRTKTIFPSTSISFTICVENVASDVVITIFLYTVLAVSTCVRHDSTTYAVLIHVEVEFGHGMCSCDTGTQCWVHKFNVEAAHFGARMPKRRPPERGEARQTEQKYGFFRG